jgi:hypothetical protein
MPNSNSELDEMESWVGTRRSQSCFCHKSPSNLAVKPRLVGKRILRSYQAAALRATEAR